MDPIILKAIQDSLPKMQVEALQKELEKAAKFDQLTKDLQASRDAHSKLILEHDSLKKLENEMKQKLEEALFVKREFEIKKLQHELACAKEVTNAVTNLAMAAFRNPTIVKSFNRNIPLKDNEYASGSTMSESSYETETRD